MQVAWPGGQRHGKMLARDKMHGKTHGKRHGKMLAHGEMHGKMHGKTHGKEAWQDA